MVDGLQIMWYTFACVNDTEKYNRILLSKCAVRVTRSAFNAPLITDDDHSSSSFFVNVISHVVQWYTPLATIQCIVSLLLCASFFCLFLNGRMEVGSTCVALKLCSSFRYRISFSTIQCQSCFVSAPVQCHGQEYVEHFTFRCCAGYTYIYIMYLGLGACPPLPIQSNHTYIYETWDLCALCMYDEWLTAGCRCIELRAFFIFHTHTHKYAFQLIFST